MCLITVIVVTGRNATVAEEQGSVEVCFTMSRLVDITISVRLTFGENSELFEAPAQGTYVCKINVRADHRNGNRFSSPLWSPSSSLPLLPPSLALFQGGIDFDNTPQDLVFSAGEQTACTDVDVFPDTVFEAMEQFCVGVRLLRSGSNRIQIPPLCGSTVTIVDTGQ